MSEITSEGPPKQPAEAGNIAITGVLGTRRLEYTFPDGEPAGEPTDIISPATFTTTLRSLQHISEQLAPGEHTDQELARASRATTKAIGYLVIRMEESAPAGIMARSEKGLVRVGNFTVEARQATEQEVADFKAREEAKAKAALEQRKVELQAAEARKTHIGMYDHALITVDHEHSYRLGLEHWDEILLARAMMHINPGEEYTLFVETLARELWRSMPLAERALFVKKEDLIYNDSTNSCRNLEKRLDILFETVTSQLGITKRRTMPGQFGFKAKSVSVQLQADPSAPMPTNAQVLAPPRRGFEDQTQQSSPQEMLEVTAVIDRVRRKSSYGMTDQECISMLDVLTSNRGKLVLARMLEATGSSETLKDMLERGHDLARRHLGDGTYWDTYRERMIGGNKSGGKSHHVTQVTGGTQYLSRTKWFVGTPKDPEGAVKPN